MKQPELVRVAVSPEFMLDGVAVSPRGRVFASFPRWTSPGAPSVMEAMPDSSFEPYPGNAWNEWQPGAPAHDSAHGRMRQAPRPRSRPRRHRGCAGDASALPG